MKKVCIKCERKKEITEFNFKDKAKGRRNARCKACTRAEIRAAYYKRREYYLKYRAQHNRLVLRKRQEFLWGYLLNHPCVDCGIADPAVLQFDHVRGKKKESVSVMIYRSGFAMKAILEEIEKCEIRCANCHAKKTAKQRGYYSSMQQAIEKK